MRTISFLLVTVCLIFTQTLSAQTGRSRPIVENGTIFSDMGTLLRGCRVSTDWSETLPPRNYITDIKSKGLNTIHLYAESFVTHTPGELHELVDSMVNWTEEDSLYLVITIGNLNENGTYDYDFAAGFWNYYAPRYADRPHVIYEIQNEPHAWSPPYPDSTLQMELDMYNIIRSHAPETPVLFFSYSTPNNAGYILQDIDGLGPTVDWSNAAVAIHGYGTIESLLEEVINELKSEGYCIINTEPPNLGDEQLNFRQTRMYEADTISYLHFMTAEEIRLDSRYEDIIEDYGISWIPDFGSWPSAVPPNEKTWQADERIEVEFFDEQGGNGVMAYLDVVGAIDGGDYIQFRQVDFEAGQNAFSANIATTYSDRRIDVVIDSVNGPIVGTCPLANTGGWDNYQTVECEIETTEGIHPLFLKFNGSQHVDWVQFGFSTGIDNNTPGSLAEAELNVFPNPAGKELMVDFKIPVEGLTTIEIVDLNGQVVYSLMTSSLTVGSYQEPFSGINIPAGIYLVRLRMNECSLFKKLIMLHE